MYTNAGFLSGFVLPLLMLAPVLQLLLVFATRKPVNSTVSFLIILCCVNALTYFFSFLATSLPAAVSIFQQTGIILELVITALLLKSCTNQRVLRQLIPLGGLVSAGISAALLATGVSEQFSMMSIQTGYLLLFLLAIAVIFNIQLDLRRTLTESPDFWFASGVFFQFGLVSLLLLLNRSMRPEDIATDGDFGLMYTIISFIRYGFFTTGLLMMRGNTNRPHSS